MHIIRATEDFRNRAERVRLRAEDMTPVKERRGLWQLYFTSRPELLQPEMIEVVKAYNKENDKYPRIEELAKSKGQRIQFNNVLDIIYLASSLYVRESRICIAIVVPRPLEPPGNNIAAADSTTTLQPPNSGNCSEEELRRAIRKSAQTGTTTNDNGLTIAKQPRELQAEDFIKAETLQQDPKIAIWIPTGAGSVGSPITLQVGDVVRLDEHEAIQVMAGGVALILVQYDVEKLVEVVNQDRDKEGGSPPLSRSP